MIIAHRALRADNIHDTIHDNDSHDSRQKRLHGTIDGNGRPGTLTNYPALGPKGLKGQWKIGQPNRALNRALYKALCPIGP